MLVPVSGVGMLSALCECRRAPARSKKRKKYWVVSLGGVSINTSLVTADMGVTATTAGSGANLDAGRETDAIVASSSSEKAAIKAGGQASSWLFGGAGDDRGDESPGC